MKTFITLVLTLTIALNSVFAQENKKRDSSFPLLEGPYLGQKPPGVIPTPFAPGIVSTDGWEVCGGFTPDLQEFYFIREVGEIDQTKKQEFVVIQNKNNRWQESIISPRVSQPFISPDGTIMHLGNRYKVRTDTSWSELKSLGAPSEDINIMRLSAAANGTYYFDTFTENLDAPLRYSRKIEGQYEAPKSLGEQFAIGTYNAHPFIAPDESYIIWDCRRESGYDSSDLYISFRAADGSWGPAINMGDQINTVDKENYPSVSADGKHLFFDRRTGADNEVNIYWVDAQLIEKLRLQ